MTEKSILRVLAVFGTDMNTYTFFRPLLVMLVILGSVVIASHLQQSRSANLTKVSATASNSRPSFSGLLGTNAVGSSQVVINVTPGSSRPSTDSAQLVEGDVVGIGDSGTISNYTVGYTGNNTASTFDITTGLGSGDADTGDIVIATASTSLTVKLRPASAINDGMFRILVPALASDAVAADGLPDSGYYDFGTSPAASITCPSNTGGYLFQSGTATASATLISGTEYHSFECRYNGAGGINEDFETSNNFVINNLINPAPKSDHVIGTADTYRIIVQHMSLDGTTELDQTPIAVGIVEAVKVTATVSPQISFSIFGVDSDQSVCGVNTSVTTTSTSVPLGELSISTFTSAAQTLTVSTNAANGYSVTARANDQLGRNGGACTGDPTTNSDCIQDSRGDSGLMSDTVSSEWVTTTNKGFGYALFDNSTSIGAFDYNESSRTFSARQFADAEAGQSPQIIFSNTIPADNNWVRVCYRAIIPATQSAGNYENYITYTATASF